MPSRSTSSLEVPRPRHTTRHPRLWTVLAVVATLALLIGWAIWFLRTPDALPTSDRRADGASVVGQELYVGMFTAGADFDRSVTISEVTVDVAADADVDVVPRLCRDGAPPVTTDVSGWCPTLEEVEGADLDAGDSIVLVVSADEPTDVDLGRLKISFREGIRSGTDEAGLEGASLTFADHDPGTVTPTEPEDETGERPGSDDDEQDDRKKDRKKDRGEGQQSQGA